jgi:CrcB protein
LSSLGLWFGVAAIGGAAAVLRFIVDYAISARRRHGFPLGTLVVNLTGTAALGFAAGVGLSGDARTLVATGLLGSYTTFSTWMLETYESAVQGKRAVAAANLVLSLAAGLGALVVGRALGRLF